MKRLRLVIMVIQILLSILMASLPVSAWPKVGKGNLPTCGESPGWSGSTPGSGGSGGNPEQPPYHIMVGHSELFLKLKVAQP